MRINRRTRSGRKRGTITYEATIAIALATAVIAGAAQILAVTAHQRRDIDRRSTAIREAGNLLEEIAARPWSDLTDERLSALTLSRECNATLREPRLNIAVAAEPDGAGRQIRIEIDWLAGNDQRAMPLRLVAWRYPADSTEESEP